MKIEILGADNMMSSGSTVLRALQNNHTPLLDLFVREVLQNSLDAANKKAKYVNVDFIYGSFKRKIFAEEFEMLSAFTRGTCVGEDEHFIAVRDSNTSGLTGPINKKSVDDGKFGNLIKLVFDLGKPQDGLGSGGSWGYGKTLYYRLSKLGFVLYYSRIKNNSGKYESRLVACMVEDETSDKSLIPSVANSSKSGIAWWGKKIEDNKIVPETNEEYISKIINIFGIKPYENEETGTTIIIPYTLRYDKLTDFSTEEENIYWSNNIAESLKVLIQRWYSPRLNNTSYKYGAYLKVSVNGEPIKRKDMCLPFLVFQGLYKSIFSDEYIEGTDFPPSFSDYITDDYHFIGVEDININNKGKIIDIGYLAYIKADRKHLCMLPPDNNYRPYIYVNEKSTDSEKNSPIFAFCRKPGMIVSYVTEGDWVRGVPLTNKDEYIFCLFVLNSESQIQYEKSIEEYFRQSEKADHNSWQDHDGEKFIEKTKRKVAKTLRNAFTTPTEDVVQEDSGLSSWLGSILLPPQGFGNGSSSSSKSDDSHNSGEGKTKGEVISVQKSLSVSFDREKTQYRSNKIILVYNLSTKKECKKVSAELKISSETGDITMADWNNTMLLDVPFEINSIKAIIEKPIKKLFELNCDNDTLSEDGYNFQLDYTDSGTVNRVNLLFDNESAKNIQLIIELDIYAKDKNPSIIFNGE